MKIESKHVVSLTYDLYTKQEDGTETFVESATEEQPLTFLFGVGQMIPGFETNLSTMSTGDDYDFVLDPADAYGEHDEKAVATLPLEMFESAGLPEIGSIVPLQDNNGNHFQGQVVSITEDSVIVDLNHPMAGQGLHFKGKILNVRPATPEELSHGHAHGADGHHHH
jgi:FKBP-type peptidyl-prolyl cis-trans isomerase SlyD